MIGGKRFDVIRITIAVFYIFRTAMKIQPDTSELPFSS